MNQDRVMGKKSKVLLRALMIFVGLAIFESVLQNKNCLAAGLSIAGYYILILVVSCIVGKVSRKRKKEIHTKDVESTLE